MSTSPVDPEDIRAAAEVQRELGPEYSDAVIAAFLDRVDRAVEARVEARLAEERRHLPVTRDGRRRTLLKGVALGVCAGALVAGASISHAIGVAHQSGAQIMVPQGHGPNQRIFEVGPNGPGLHLRISKPGAPLPPPKS